MSGVHFTEVLLLAVIALIVLGPERLPVIARTVGKLSRQARDAWQSVQSELQAELDLEHNRKIMQATNAKDASTDARTERQTPAEIHADESIATDEGTNEPPR